jgi:DNA-binding beta-propeller fold protein YncE
MNPTADSSRRGSCDRVGSRAGTPRRRSTLLALALGAFLLALTPTLASAAEPEYELLEKFGPDGTEATGFTTAGSVVIDQQSNMLYVMDQQGKKLFKFDTEGEPVGFGGSAPYISGNEISGLNPFAGSGEAQVAVDSSSHTVYVTNKQSLRAFQADGEPFEFTAGPGAGTSEIGGFAELDGLATDVDGNIYASDFGPGGTGVVRIFDPSGEPITQIDTLTPANLAVDGHGAVYVVRWHATVLKFTPSEFPITPATTYTAAAEPLNTKSSNTVAVDPATNNVYVAQDFSDPKVCIYDEDGTLLNCFAGAGEEGEVRTSGGIAIDADDGRVFVANNPSSDSGLLSQVGIFGLKEAPEPEVPTIAFAGASDVLSNGAALVGEIVPNLAETTYYFEYGPEDCSLSECARVPVGGSAIGSGDEPVAVSQQIGGLQPGTTYHYRLVAENAVGLTEGSGRTLTTQLTATGFDLADDRAWEMVSPPNKHGAKLAGSSGHIQASADGNGLAYLSFLSIESVPDGYRSEASSVLARRGAGGSWSSKDLASANDSVVPISLGRENEFKLFGPDLSQALVEARSPTLLSPDASERTPYLRTNTEPATYFPLVTGKEGFANVPPGTEFGGDADEAAGPVSLAGADQDLSHVVVASTVPLAVGAPSGALYQWADGQLEPVSVLPAGEGGAIASSQNVGSGAGSKRGAISEDGSRIFWSRGQYGISNDLTALYLRDTEADLSARLDVAQPGASGAGTARPTFQGASADGTVVFFTDSRQLTEGASPSGFDLYRCEILAGEEAAGCTTLTDVSAPLEGSGESAEVQDIVAAIDEDGTSVYFVAKGVLDEAPNGHGDSAVAGEANLYLWQQGSGVRFIAALDPVEDGANWGEVGTASNGSAARLSTAGSPSGRYLAFMSQRSLTGYENRDAESGEAAQEVFRYDAAADRLDCVSCNPSGALPQASARAGELSDPRGSWDDRLVAAVLPEATQMSISGESLYRTRSVLDNGRVFFNAFDSLVPADSNGQWDVYQHEPTGVGDCVASSGDADTARSGAGCVALLSSGTAEEEAGFLDASVTGDDVFFLTPAQLNETDEDKELDVYDARVDGVPATLPEINECLGEACQPAAEVLFDQTPASAAFRGAGNVSSSERRRCGTNARAGRLARRAEALRRKAKRANNPKAAEQLRRKARRHAREASGLSKRAKRCRRANRRAYR